MANTAISVEGLVKVYGTIRAIDDISFDIKEQEVFAFLGPNGAGKTTTVEILQSLRKSTKGRVKVLGYDISNRRQETKEGDWRP